MLRHVNRRARRHPIPPDPVAELQEESRWSGFTTHIRATNQGKRLFHSSEKNMGLGGGGDDRLRLVDRTRRRIYLRSRLVPLDAHPGGDAFPRGFELRMRRAPFSVGREELGSATDGS